MAWHDAKVGYKDASTGISVKTKMLHIDSTKLHQRGYEGETLKKPQKPLRNWQRHAKLASSQWWRHRRVLLVKQSIVVSQCLLQPMPSQKSYTPPQKNLIFLISFPCSAQVCNISTKAVVSFLCVQTKETIESIVLLGILSAHIDILDC